MLRVNTENQNSKVEFTRVGIEPLLTPRTDVTWEAGGVFAPAVIKEGDNWRMLYRAFGADRRSRLGYAESEDGLHWSREVLPRVVPISGNSNERDGAEDPRIIKLNGHYYITYTAVRGRYRKFKTRIRILQTTDFINYKRLKLHFNWNRPRFDKDGVLLPTKTGDRYWLLHRIPPAVRLSSSPNLKRWRYETTLLKPTNYLWESVKVGAGPPPLKTKDGWLLFYHGVSDRNMYGMGAAIFTLEPTPRLLYRLPYPILCPEKSYETTGVVPNVVFGTAAVELDDRYRLYYGGADTVIAAAEIDKQALLEELHRHPVS